MTEEAEWRMGLVGRTISETRYMTPEENKVLGFGFEKMPLMIWFTNHSYLFASPIETKEGPAGTLLGGSLKTSRIWRLPPKAVK